MEGMSGMMDIIAILKTKIICDLEYQIWTFEISAISDRDFDLECLIPHGWGTGREY